MATFLLYHLSHISYDGTNPSCETFTLMNLLPPKGPILHTITLEIRASTHGFGGNTNTQSIAPMFCEIMRERTNIGWFPWSWEGAISYPKHFHLALVVLKCWPCFFKSIFETLTKWPKRSSFWSDDRVRASTEMWPRVRSVDVIVTRRSKRAYSCQHCQ